MFKNGDEVVTVSPFWHLGSNIGDRLGTVINTSGYILINLHDYDSNPVKCFRDQLEIAYSKEYSSPSDNLDDESHYVLGLFDPNP